MKPDSSESSKIVKEGKGKSAKRKLEINELECQLPVFKEQATYERKLQVDWSAPNHFMVSGKTFASPLVESKIDTQKDGTKTLNLNTDQYIPRLPINTREDNHSAFTQYINYYRDKSLLYYSMVPPYNILGGSSIANT